MAKKQPTSRKAKPANSLSNMTQAQERANTINQYMADWREKHRQERHIAQEIARETARIQSSTIDAPSDPIKTIRQSTEYKMLSDIERSVFDYLVQEGPKTGKEICNALGIEDEGSLRSHYLPSIRRRFVVDNRRGVGYVIDLNKQVTKR